MKKIKLLLIGTHNDGKFKEISQINNKKNRKDFTKKFKKLKPQKKQKKSLKSNSELKADFYVKSKITSLSDDSGLEVFALNNKPGIYSARWAKKNGSFYKSNESTSSKLSKSKIEKQDLFVVYP